MQRIAAGAILVLVVLLAAYMLLSGPKNAGGTASAAFAIGAQSGYVYSLNGTLLYTFNYTGTFLIYHNTTRAGIAGAFLPKSDIVEFPNMPSDIKGYAPQRVNRTAQQQKVVLAGTPVLSPKGFTGNFSLIQYAGGAVGKGQDSISLYQMDGNGTARWSLLYRQGAGMYDFYAVNGSYIVYNFFFANLSAINESLFPGEAVNGSVVPQTSPMFPSRLLPQLNADRNDSGAQFVRDGEWWYFGRFVVKIGQNGSPWRPQQPGLMNWT